MAIKKVEAANGKTAWRVDIQPGGRSGRRISKTLPTKAEAIQWEAWATTNALKTPDWAPAKSDFRKVTALVELWWTAHGQGLNAGENTKARSLAALRAMGDPTPGQLTPTKFTDYRAERRAAGKQIGTLNREHAYLRAIVNQLIALKEWTLENPFAAVPQLRQKARELSYLDDKQVDELLIQLKASDNRHALPVAKMCLATGLRWTEAETLHRRQIKNGRVSVIGKNGNARHLPIAPKLEKEVLAHHDPIETGDRLFSSCYGAFESAIDRCTFELPRGQLSHVLRHTFASQFMQRGGSIITLQRALDHDDLKTTMRYAHLAPDHLDQVLQLNPLARLYKPQAKAKSLNGDSTK